ncbi:MAG: aspartate aminotransferase family protein [Vulcanimicrobiaceae bacterium]
MSESLPPLPAVPSPPNDWKAPPIMRHPPMLRSTSEAAPDPRRVEAMLTEWFGAPTLLFSSGRAATHAVLAELGFDRNRQTIRVPRFLTRCILNALALDAFPVWGDGADAVLYYHPFGFRLRSVPREPVVIEDAVHAFFTSPVSGARSWRGVACVFSLSKFFSTSGISGALVVPDPALAQRIAARRDRTEDIDPALAAWRHDVIVGTNLNGDNWPGAHLLDAAYSLLTEFPKVDPQTLIGVPSDLSGLKATGMARHALLQVFADRLGSLFPHDVVENGLDDVPFVLPYFGSGNREKLLKIDVELLKLGIRCRGMYELNTGGEFYEPEYRDGLLIPCHQYMAPDVVEKICDVILNIDGDFTRVAG